MQKAMKGSKDSSIEASENVKNSRLKRKCCNVERDKDVRSYIKKPCCSFYEDVGSCE